ncbi:MAG: hypothetical protein HW416_1335 [Chloroflexi bacterium]|nr:hypothetical protein [Chloroflexota bacterium]
MVDVLPPAIRAALRAGWTLGLVASLAACTPPAGPSTQQAPSQQQGERPGVIKTLTIGITGAAPAMGVMGPTNTNGGWHSVGDVHSHGLTTTDTNSRRPVGRLAENIPNVDDGSVSLLPDGRMRVAYTLRPGITWQDGVPFTAQDLAFSYRFNSDKGLPTSQQRVINLMDSVEAPDTRTFVVYYRGAYYLGGVLGFRELWPQPQHLLGEAYDRYVTTGNPDEVVALPYWTSAYVHLGPFRLTSFDPADGTEHRAYDGYFLGRPKVDIVRIRAFANDNVLYSNLLAGAIDVFADTALGPELGTQLKQRWDESGDGKVHVRPGGTPFLSPQMRPASQIEAANLDPRARGALLMAIDHEAFTQQGQLPAWSMLPPGDPMYDAVKDGLRRYPYDPERAKALLRDLGWSPGSDGVLRNASDGRRFRNAIWVVVGNLVQDVSVVADYWRRIGLEVDEYTISAAQTRDGEFRASYPGWEISSSGGGDSILGRLEGPAASAATRWVGNRGGYDDPRAEALITRYYTSLSEREQFAAMAALSDFVVSELPLLPLYYQLDFLGSRKGIRALDDSEGGAQPSVRPFGTYSRNAHLWDVL